MPVSTLKKPAPHEPWRLLGEEKPLRAEPFSEDHLAQHARELAGLLSCTTSVREDSRFLRRFDQNAQFLREAIRVVATSVREGLPLRPDAEWLLDNFYIVEEQLREIQDDFPRRYYHELPKSDFGEPRVYSLAVELVAHTDSVLNEETIVRFVTEFQAVSALSMGEVWAIPIMLRLSLVENLRRIASQMLSGHASERRAREIVENWVEGTPFPIDLTPIEEHGSLIFHVIDKLQQDGAANLERIRELERRLITHDLTLQQSVHLEHQRQASSQVSIGNVITSMRLISAIDWVAFFERTNLTEQVLRRDPAGIYPNMDFESRDRYRHVVEDLADGCQQTETEIAETVLSLAHRPTNAPRMTHVGYWLVDAGRGELEGLVKFRPKLTTAIGRWFENRPNLAYLGGIFGVTTLVLAVALSLLAAFGASSPALLWMGLLAILPASEIAVVAVNTVVTSWLRPRLLPKLDFSFGIPSENRAIVVVPCLLSRPAEIESLLQKLEIHYLSNPDPMLSFALLTDFPDASQAEMPTDSAYLQETIDGIRMLNKRHAVGTAGPFFLFHRARRWNPQEGVWMGWERKRGKLMEFNALLRGRSDTSYIVQEGDRKRLFNEGGSSDVRYVITLDADTTLPHDSARRMIATMAHPLNAPVYDTQQHRFTSGYVVLQPRVTVNLSSAQHSRYAQLFANNPGLDPYATCASDVYQDLFGEGSFTGKGIYDVDAFELAVEKAFPENLILSHDLIEGCHARVALVSDIELFDSFPAKYQADQKRQHRWVRGDWQIAPWLFSLVPWAGGRRRNRLSVLSRWKIFDNLRRSLVAPAMLMWFVAGWLLLPNFAGLVTAAGLLVLLMPILAQLGVAVRFWPRNVPFRDQLQVVGNDLKRSLIQTMFITSFLPEKAWTMSDAVIRTLYRMIVSHERMLEWTTASDVDQLLAKKSGRSVWEWIAIPTACVLIGIALGPVGLLGALPVLILWGVAPLLHQWLDSPPSRRTAATVSDDDRIRMRLHARRIWAFFEAYVGPHDHWLPPDNVQEYPEEKIAHRISPTNEGLFLISGLVARDFGYITVNSLIELWENNLTQWQLLPRMQGHFYNWYDTVTLEPLLPRYVSTVDSGNLLACLLTLQKGYEDLLTAPLAGPELERGLVDTIAMITEAGTLMELSADRRVAGHWERLTKSVDRLHLPHLRIPSDPLELWRVAQQLHDLRAELATHVEPLAVSLHGTNQGILLLIRILLDWLASVSKEFTEFYAWGEVYHEGIAGGENPQATLKLRWRSEADLAVPLRELRSAFSGAKCLSALTQLSTAAAKPLDDLSERLASAGSKDPAASEWIERLRASLVVASNAAQSLERRLVALSEQTSAMAESMDFRMLYNPQRKLFSIGFNLETNRLDGSHYDMLCSEARIASFLAVAKGDVESRHWFRLGRQMTQTAGRVSLLSWGGTMFEYLMPQLFQKMYDQSLLTESSIAAVARQQEYGRQRGIPWGISECAFGALAANSDYHYKSFGVPGLGLKRGLSKDLVISPYSTLLAVEVDPRGAIENLHRLEQEGGLGLWGFYEALDFTPERVLAGKRSITVRCYMAHHQGMGLLALGNFLVNQNVRRRFHDHPLVRATELLLQERTQAVMPRLEPHADEQAAVPVVQIENEMVSRRIVGVATAVPRLQLLSNGQYHVMVTSTGGGYSQFKSLGITRWRSDATRDHWGQFLYLRDLKSGRVWSATYQPTCAEPNRYEVIYSIDKAEYFRRDGQFETQLEVAVSPENNAEMRQLRITNYGRFEREIEITSYAEVSLVEPAADVAHMAFQKLFIETEYISEKAALVARRRPRDSRQQAVWAVHVLAAPTDVVTTMQFETSRQEFLGRGRTAQNPAAMDQGAQLSGTVGAVLDPIFSIRCRIKVPADESVTVSFTTCMGATREEVIALADQYSDSRGVQRGFELAWAYSQVELRHLHLSPSRMHLYQRLAAAMLYPDRNRRAPGARLLENRQGQRGLWRYGISGTVPIFVVYVTKPEQIELVRESLGAHLYWKARGLKTEFVIVNDYPGSYFDAMQEQLIELLQELQIRLDDKPPEVFLLRGAQIPVEDKLLLDAVASVVLHGDRGSFVRQVETATATRPSEPERLPAPAAKSGPAAIAFHASHVPPRETNRYEIVSPKDLEFWNGTGGFAHDGSEYHIRLTADQTTPMPWSNVIANSQFGCLLTESGGGYTWFSNSRENKLTTWANDPVADTPGEALYVYDADTGESFSPLCGLHRTAGEYWVQHGHGYSRYIHRSNEITQQALVSIAPNDPVKFVILTMRNESSQSRKLSVTYYAEWVLGVSREETQMHVRTSIDEQTGALLARNSYHPEFPGQVAFLQVLNGDRTLTGDRQEFLGRNGNLAKPAAMRATRLSGQTGAGLDPCGAMRLDLKFAPEEEIEVIYLLGAAESVTAVTELLTRYATADAVHHACHQTAAQWRETLQTIEVKSPNRAFDLIVNRWLLYQTLSCRVLGRSAYYQSGGAFGFRDQLQDVMALVYSRPELARAHILNAASRQFEEGDVQHWWHPPLGRGTRTRFSDDLLWLPFVVCHYLAVTKDASILDEQVSFLHSPPLEPHQQERYETPEVSSQHATLYEHCRRTIEHGFRTGVHGLPLMGCGDWNDGMNKVGEEGRGESVWVGWFLLVLLERFLPLMHERGDQEEATEWQRRREELKKALEDQAWDGEWYRRAYFDDETPLGSIQNDECQIDSLGQTWAVIAGADPGRSRQAIESVMTRLVQWKAKLVLLFTPPFNKSQLDPGYIKGYVPGIRENGGQYTHSATWLIQALAQLNDVDRAMHVFDLINPVNHATNREQVAIYQVEPYVVAADVYGVSPHTGRGGWTWYTGSAAWLYRAGIEFILGFSMSGNTVCFNPRVPRSWKSFEFTLRRDERTWRFLVARDDGTLSTGAEGSTFVAGRPISLDELRSDQKILVRIPQTSSASEESSQPENIDAGLSEFGFSHPANGFVTKK